MKMIGVDVGGTFTDVVAVEDGQIRAVKVQTNVRATERGVLEGASEIGVAGASLFNHASTHGLNAVITRQLPKIGFLTTQGHRDMLDGGRVWRPAHALTDPNWRRPFGDAARPLVARYLRRGIRERMTASGEVLIALDEVQARAELSLLLKCQVQGVAICLLHGYRYARHEQRLRELVFEMLGPIPCSISSETSPLAKEYTRASTTVIDTCMRLIYGNYTRRLDDGLRALGFRGALNYADCAAQLVGADVAMKRPFRIVFAGPAAGTVASAHFGKLVGAHHLLCADVGGTSCDISLVTAGKPYVNTTFELEHDLIVNALSIEVSSIGAGGGSLISINSAGEVRVGPASAGADPGPACYGKSGKQPALTDACLLMGIVDANSFAGGRVKLDAALARQAFESLDTPLSLQERISFAFQVGVNNIAEGIADIAVLHGVDPRDYSLVAFGAAGPMLLPAVLDIVHAAEVIVPPYPGLFSALGLVSSDQVFGDSQSAYTVLERSAAQRIDALYRQMESRLRDDLKEGQEVRWVRTFDGQLLGQSWDTPFVAAPSGQINADVIDRMIANFHDAYEARWSNRFADMPVQAVTFRVEAIVPSPKVEYPRLAARAAGTAKKSRSIQLRYLGQESVAADEYDRAALAAGDEIHGPAVIRETMSTTLLLAGQILTVGDYGELRIRRNLTTQVRP